jgi:uncharacterized protein
MRPLEAPARLRAQQVAFAAHLRDPAQPAPVDIEDRRMAIYRDLFYNSLEGLLANNFPVLRRLRGDGPWHALVRDFYREHRCHTPLFPELGREFLRYLETRAEQGRAADPPFLLELAHYEWVELALSLDDSDPSALDADPRGDLLAGVPVLSPLAWPLAYAFPVQQIRPDFQPAEPPPQPTFLLVVRDGEGDIHFKAIDALGFHLLQAVAGNDSSRSGEALLRGLAAQAGVGDADGFVASGGRLLAQLRERAVILGTRR